MLRRIMIGCRLPMFHVKPSKRLPEFSKRGFYGIIASGWCER